MTRMVCEGTNLSLACGAHHVLVIQRAHFGPAKAFMAEGASANGISPNAAILHPITENICRRKTQSDKKMMAKGSICGLVTVDDTISRKCQGHQNCSLHADFDGLDIESKARSTNATCNQSNAGRPQLGDTSTNQINHNSNQIMTPTGKSRQSHHLRVEFACAPESVYVHRDIIDLDDETSESLPSSAATSSGEIADGNGHPTLTATEELTLRPTQRLNLAGIGRSLPTVIDSSGEQPTRNTPNSPQSVIQSDADAINVKKITTTTPHSHSHTVDEDEAGATTNCTQITVIMVTPSPSTSTTLGFTADWLSAIVFVSSKFALIKCGDNTTRLQHTTSINSDRCVYMCV